MPNTICVLHSWETVDLEKHGIPPTCSNHKHINKLEAMELTARGDNVGTGKAARWLGQRMICYTVQGTWIPLQSGYAGPSVLQFQG